MRKSFVIVAFMSVLSSGCAIKPIPDDVTGITTVAIVSKIRCECQNSIYELLFDQLKSLGDPESLKRLEEIKRNRAKISLLRNYNKLPEQQKEVFEKFDRTVVVLDFQLRMTENNNISGASNLARPFTNGLDLIGLKLSDSLARQNFRTFRVTTNIRELFTDHCDENSSELPNYQYPIAGKIGLKETFGTYFALANINNLGALKDWTGNSPFVDTIKFTTTISGELDPSFNLTPKGRGFVVRDASGALSASRVDEHQLIVGISLPDTSKGLAATESTKAAVNIAVDRSITKLQLFGLNPINPFGPLNSP